MLRETFLPLAVAFACVTCAVRADSLRVAGSQIMEPVVSAAAQVLRTESGMDIHISAEGGTSAAVAALAGHKIDVAMSARPVAAEDRADHPDITFTEIQIGEQVLALGVSRNVWEGGVHSLTRDQMKSIYQSKITNWREVGGPDQKISFFNFEEGFGVWELFVQWLYGDSNRAPAGRFQTIASYDEARTALEFTPGAMALISPLLVDKQRSFALEIKNANGKTIAPTPQAAMAGSYPLARPLFLIVNDKPTGEAKALVDFLLGPRGQQILQKHGFHSADMLRKTDATD